MISAVVMAHQRRREWAENLASRLDCEIVWDRRNDRGDTGLRSLQAFDPAASHHLVVQDDAIICRDLIDGLTKAVEVAQDRIVGLYVGAARPLSRFRLDQLARGADARGASWIEWPGTIWGVAVLYPTEHLPALIRSYRRDPIANYDTRVENCARKRGITWWYTWPSLVDHRSGPENPSLVPGRTNHNRRAYRFIGEDASALDVDWHAPVYNPKRR